MGAFINPIHGTAEQFLKEHGTEITQKQAEKHDDFKDKFLVVVIDNYLFRAAGIAFSKAEKTVMTDPWEQRPRKFYLVDKEELLKVSNLAEYLK